MDKLTSLNLTFDRVVIQFIIPGLVALLPYLVLLFHEKSEFEEYLLNEGKTLLIVSICFLALIIGIMLENLGSRIEVYIYDTWQKKEHTNYMDVWYAYLTIAFEKEPVGQRYLRNILFRMKFEVSMACALLIMAGGLFALNSRNDLFESHFWRCVVIYILPITISFWLLFEGWQSSQILHKVRSLLVEEQKKPSSA